jgi:hypothetical protein
MVIESKVKPKNEKLPKTISVKKALIAKAKKVSAAGP